MKVIIKVKYYIQQQQQKSFATNGNRLQIHFNSKQKSSFNN